MRNKDLENGIFKIGRIGRAKTPTVLQTPFLSGKKRIIKK
jgi:hypothetical protein